MGWLAAQGAQEPGTQADLAPQVALLLGEAGDEDVAQVMEKCPSGVGSVPSLVLASQPAPTLDVRAQAVERPDQGTPSGGTAAEGQASLEKQSEAELQLVAEQGSELAAFGGSGAWPD